MLLETFTCVSQHVIESSWGGKIVDSCLNGFCDNLYKSQVEVNAEYLKWKYPDVILSELDFIIT